MLVHMIYTYIQLIVLELNLATSKFIVRCLLLTASFLSSIKQQKTVSMGHTQKKLFIDKEIYGFMDGRYGKKNAKDTEVTVC